MLKRFPRLGVLFASILTVLVLSSNAYSVTSNVVIAQVQTGASGAAKQEFVSIHNNSDTAVDVTNWCLMSGANQLGCLGPPNASTQLLFQPRTYLTFASTEFNTSRVASDGAAYVPNGATFVAAGGSSGSIVGSSGSITIQNGQDIVDTVSWDSNGLTAPDNTKNQILQRKAATPPSFLSDTGVDSDDFMLTAPLVLPLANANSLVEQTVPVDVCPNTPEFDAVVPVGFIKDTDGNCYEDVCDNLPGLQKTIPAGYERFDSIDCVPLPPENAPLLITEILPNSASTDTGNEFIEIYNPNARAVNLKDYKLELGPSFTKSFVLPDQALEAGAYVSFSDTQTGIVLPNTTATVRLTAPAGNVVDETAAYDAPADDLSWAMISGTWQYTNHLTPGSANVATVDPGVGGGADPTDELDPCPAGKFRNPDTNRCKNIEDAEGTLTPCAADQIRNPETNRCRSVLTTGSTLTPCQPGQERNPETNRCRSTATTAAASLKPCAANQERNPETNRCRNKASSTAAGKVKDIAAEQVGGSHNGWMITGGVVAAAAGYGAWEWRSEVAAFGRRLKEVFGKSPPTD